MDIIILGRTYDISRGSEEELVASQNRMGGSLRGLYNHPTADRLRTSQFEQIASAAASISPQRVKLLGILLPAAPPALCGGPPLLRPIWATEALHRAHSMIRLVARLEQNAPRRKTPSESVDFENKLGRELASIFDSLAIAPHAPLRACSRPVRDIARNLIDLFGPGVGHIAVTTSVERLALPAFQQRALVLLTSELIINGLLHAFENRTTGRIALRLARPNRGIARLVVTDDGSGLVGATPHYAAQCGVINDLADLLQSEVTYRSAPGAGTVAEIDIRLQE